MALCELAQDRRTYPSPNSPNGSQVMRFLFFKRRIPKLLALNFVFEMLANA